MLAWCQQEALLHPGDRVVCAVSGGKDSMVLLDLLTLLAPTLGITVSAAHFHHGLRGEEADRDARFVEAYCAAHQIPFVCGHGQTAARAAETGESIEQAARTLRYEFLQAVAGDALIATAHTAEDHVETVLMNLLRGTGLRGLGGIPPKRDKVIRPILCLDRQQVAAWLAQRSLPHVEDSTNASRNHLRNRIRLDVLPSLTAEAPALAAALVEQGRRLRQDADLLDSLAQTLLQQATQPQGLAISPLLDAPAPLASRAVLFWLRENGVRDPGARHVAAVLGLMQQQTGSAQLALPGQITVLRTYAHLTVLFSAPVPPPATLPVPGTLEWGAWQLETRLLPCWDGRKGACLLRPPCGPLTVRSRRTGDRLTLPGGTKSLKKLMIDRKIPAHLREQLPVLLDGDAVVWAFQVGVSAAYAPVPCEPAIQLIITQKESDIP